MFIINVLPLREFCSPKSQFTMVNVCVLSMYYHVLLFQISDDQQRIPGNWSESSRIRSIRPHTPRMMQNSHILLTYSILCFRHLPRQRTFRKSSRSCKFHAVHPHSPRTTRNSHILLTYSILCFRHLPQQGTLTNSSELCKFHAIRPHSPRITQNSHHLLTLHLTFQMPDQWQRTP